MSLMKRQCLSNSLHAAVPTRRLLTQPHPVRNSRRMPMAVSSNNPGPAYNKYRSRRDIERDYYKDWERTTLIAEEELNRPMTPLTFMSFLPTWFRFYGLPGPVRFLCYVIWKRIALVTHLVHKKLTLLGAKLDAALLQRQHGGEAILPPRSLILQRYHRRIPVQENIRYRLALLKKQVYNPKPLPKPSEPLLPYALRDQLEASNYDSTADPWTAS
jgi:hypothetical protein